MRRKVISSLKPSRLLSYVRSSKEKRAQLSLWAVFFIMVGITTLLATKAATPTASIEPENSSRSGSLSVQSGGQSSGTGYVRFGSVANQYANLAKLLAATSRNRSADNPANVSKPSAGLENDSSLLSSSYVSSYTGSTDPSVTPGEGFGEFRAECDFSHYAYDDPIVYPNQPGKAHLHMIFGNTHTNAYSNYNSLLNSGNSTCNGHELNRTAYWVPAVIDQDGNPRRPIKVLIYYKSYSITNTQTDSWAPGNNGLE